MKVKNVTFDPKRVKAGPEDGLKEGEFVVYPSTFIRKPDAYGDVVAKGAFARTIKEWEDSGNVLPGLYGHRMDDPDYFVAGAAEMGEDEHGWWVRGSFDLESPKGAQVYRLVRDRKLTQLSFAYDVREEARIELEDGQKANELRDVKVYEFSFVPIGANQDTSVVAIKTAREIAAKAGRVISAKNEASLREALTALEKSASQITDVLSALDAGGEDQPKATEPAEAKSTTDDEEPEGAKSEALDEEPKSGSPVALLAAKFNIYATAYAVEKGA